MSVSAPEVTKAETPAKKYTLNSTHRCDRCGAQAYVKVTLTSGLDLLFCGHHYSRVTATLSPLVDTVMDERDRLQEGNRQQGSEN